MTRKINEVNDPNQMSKDIARKNKKRGSKWSLNDKQYGEIAKNTGATRKKK